MTEKQKIIGEIMHHVNNALSSPFCKVSLLMLEIDREKLSKEEIISELKELRNQISSVGEYLSEIFKQND